MAFLMHDFHCYRSSFIIGRLYQNKDAKGFQSINGRTGLVDQELTRNRQRVMEIKHYIELQEEELEDWLPELRELMSGCVFLDYIN